MYDAFADIDVFLVFRALPAIYLDTRLTLATSTYSCSDGMR